MAEDDLPDGGTAELVSPDCSLLDDSTGMGSVDNLPLSLAVLADVDGDMVNLALAVLVGSPEESISWLDLGQLDMLALLEVVLTLGQVWQMGSGDFADSIQDQAYDVT